MISHNYDIIDMISYTQTWLWYHRCFTSCIYSMVYHTSDIVGVDYDIINTDLWYHSYMVSYVYQLKYLGCYIIGRDLWYHSCLPISESHVISYTKYHMWHWMSNVKLSTPLSKQLNLALHSRLFRQAEVFLRLGEEETETILMS